MSYELDAHLPEGKYVKKWDQKIKDSNIDIHLKVLMDSDWTKGEATDLQKMLQEYKIPINRIKDSGWWTVTYFGSSEDIGKYKLKYAHLWMTGEDILILKVKSGKDIVKVTDLMTVVREYINQRKELNQKKEE